MYARIALGNVRKSFRDFSVFFLTLAFNLIASRIAENAPLPSGCGAVI